MIWTKVACFVAVLFCVALGSASLGWAHDYGYPRYLGYPSYKSYQSYSYSPGSYTQTWTVTPRYGLGGWRATSSPGNETWTARPRGALGGYHVDGPGGRSFLIRPRYGLPGYRIGPY